MAQENLSYAMLCTDAYIVDVHECDYNTSLYFFDIALPSGDHIVEHNQPILACSLCYHSRQHLALIPSGVYHIRAKVRPPLATQQMYSL